MKNDNIKGNFTMISNSIIRDPNLTPHAKTIFILIKSYSPSFPSYSRIIKETGVKSRSTVSKALSELKIRKLVRVIDSPKYKSNLYEFPTQQPLDSLNTANGLESVHEMDTNNTKLIKPNNNINEASTDPPVEAAKVAEIFAKAESSLGPAAKLRYRQKKRPTFIIEASK